LLCSSICAASLRKTTVAVNQGMSTPTLTGLYDSRTHNLVIYQTLC
jgi:hypothetical protein